MPLILRLGDPGSHGGNMISSASRTKAEGILICRIGDIYACALHGPNPVVSGCTRTKAEGPNITYHGAVTACGAVMSATAIRTKVE